MAMFSSERELSLDVVVRRVNEWPGSSAIRQGEQLVTIGGFDEYTEVTYEVSLGLETGPWVREENAELASDPRASDTQREALRRADRRVDIAWRLHESEAAFHTLLFTKDLIVELTGAVVFDTTGGGFI
jgi:hypothetical protein